MNRRPIGEFRTPKQIEADKLDLEVFRVVRQIDRFANEFRDDAVRQMAANIDGLRHRIRKHMHRVDCEATQ